MPWVGRLRQSGSRVAAPPRKPTAVAIPVFFEEISHWGVPCENRRLFHRTHRIRTMDAERINLIGTTLADLATRTQELRRYL